MKLYKVTLFKQKMIYNDTKEVYVLAENTGLAEEKALEANALKFNGYYERVLQIVVVATEYQYDNIGIIHL